MLHPKKLTLITTALIALLIPITVVTVNQQTRTLSQADDTPTPLPSFIPTPSHYPPSIPPVRFAPSYKHTFFQSEFITKDRDANEILQVTATGLPDGLTLGKCTNQPTSTGSSLSCVISGLPTTTGSFTVTLTAIDKMGNTAKTTTQLVVRNWYERFSLLTRQ